MLLFCLLLLSEYGWSQLPVFPEMGQLPSSAFPLCAVDTFRQLFIPAGSGGYIDIPGCGKLEARNPYYYSFTCYVAGQLAILIVPIDSLQDFNWELFDITGHDANEIYTNKSLAVIGNWSGTYGRTGATTGGSPTTLCLSDPTSNVSTFSSMPTLVLGHHYVLLVSGYSKSQSDYLLSFAGSTAVIADPASPHLRSAYMGCNSKIITVLMNKHMQCYSLAPDGSDFSLNSATVSITGASGIHCNDQFDFDSVQLTLSDTVAPGNYTLTAKTGSDAKNIWDNCFNPTPVGDQVSFTVGSNVPVSADFSYYIGYGCLFDTTSFIYPFTNNANQSQWFIDSVLVSSLFEPTIVQPVFGPRKVQHIVSNGFCSDTVTAIINLDNILKAGFRSPDAVCPKDLVTFTDTSVGHIISWNWNFGDGTASDQQKPAAHLFPETQSEKKYQVTLIVGNNLGCFDTVSTSVVKLQSCYIAVPNAFTPNGDGKNDYLYPLNAASAKDLEFMVFNRYGQLLFEARDGHHKWDGSINGKVQPTGTYIWTLRYTDSLSGKKIVLRGTSVLIR